MCTYNLKYNGYNKHVCSGLQALFTSADISDLTLAVEGKFFKVHQVVLSLFSPYFRELFCVRPSKNTIFFMKNVKYNVMQYLLEFIYEGKVKIPQEDFTLFMETAHELQIKGLSHVIEPILNDSPKCDVSSIEPSANTSSLKRQVEMSQLDGDSISKKCKVMLQTPVLTVQVDDAACPLSVPSTSCAQASPVRRTDHMPTIGNITGSSDNDLLIPKQEVNSDDSTTCSDNNDVPDGTYEFKWEESDIELNTETTATPDLLEALGDIQLKQNESSQSPKELSTSFLLQLENIERNIRYRAGQLKVVKEQNKQIINMLQQRDAEPPRCDLPVALPLQTFADINCLEKYLQEKSNFNLFIDYISRFGGKNTTTCTNFILKQCLSNQIASELNFLGKGTKKAFSSLLLNRAVVAAVQRTNPDSFESEIHGYIKVWLKHAPQRFKYEGQKANKL